VRKLVVFNQVTLDGYIADTNGDMSWAHKQDAERNGSERRSLSAQQGAKPPKNGKTAFNLDSSDPAKPRPTAHRR
jgi:hypothetical protein